MTTREHCDVTSAGVEKLLADLSDRLHSAPRQDDRSALGEKGQEGVLTIQGDVPGGSDVDNTGDMIILMSL